ncbi:hypothetical protein ES319_D01G142000v1 [Gossypium barbadense]|uniref:Pre-mRNA-splicing factor SLU7 n=2 Tax=Gossypium TaxID=3633 RepID=A0A5J5SNG4_GOSBA|nr:hypothetical protein ES319_D01G142000v1 [Gossypium barbadense]TYH87966.1 hypothetical protein ES332_D01G154700v1 [Gossypium tomentosum]
MDFAKLAKHVRTTGGGSMGTVRNLCTWEDTVKYLLNLDVNSAYYDPKTRSMCDILFLMLILMSCMEVIINIE